MNISFMLTQDQVRRRIKTHTRRLGWLKAKPGQRLTGIEKGQGLKKGEKVVRLCQIELVRVWREPLEAITPEDVVKEGFPGMTPAEFVAMFCKHNKCMPFEVITVLEFKYV